MTLNPKQIIELEAVNLIKHMTEFEEDEENFEICERFVLSNLLYHKYLDPDERKIDKSIKGISEKFKVHAQLDKAKHLEDLITKFKDSQVFKERLEQHDLPHRLLSLLLNLADNPVNVEYVPGREISEEPEEEGKVDWLAILKDGEESPKHFGSESDLSVWSEDSESEELSSRSRHSDQHEPVLASRKVAQDSFSLDNTMETWFQENVQFPYWDEEQDLKLIGTNTFTTQIEQSLEQKGKLDVRTEKLSEYQLIREVLWMLRAPTESPVFELRNGEFVVTDLVALLSATDQAVKSMLNEVSSVLGHIYTLHGFIHQINCSPAGSVPHTVEAYTSGLNHGLEQFSRFLLDIELEISSQETTFTTLMLLDKLRIWFRKIKGLVSIHSLATRDYFDLGVEENCYKCMRILSVLYNAVIASIYPDMIDLLMDMFLMSLKPYLTILDTWLVHGVLVDYRQEFIFYKNSEDLEDVWNNAFKDRLYLPRLIQEKIQPISLFVKLIKRILVAGKSNEILYKMDKLSASQIVFFNLSIYNEFLSSIKERIPKFTPRAAATSKIPSIELNSTNDASALNDSGIDESENGHSDKDKQDVNDILQLAAEDEFLVTAFSNLIQGLDSVQEEVQSPRCEKLGINLDPMIPLESILSDSLAAGVIKHYNRSSQALVDLIMKELDLEKELSKARLIFFMEAGDLMQDFNYQIFQIIHRKDSDLLDSSSLTLLLQDSLSQRFEGWVQQFSCGFELSEEDKHSPVLSLRGLSINMTISWPLNIILSEDNMKMYNKIFLFLVNLKHSLWCLQSISLPEIAKLDRQIEKEENEDKELNENSFNAGQKQHRLQLLRAWLLYFVTLLHGYFMSRVVHSTQLELREGLTKATDLDMLIDVHQLYLTKIHDTCFLHPEVRMLKEAINMILGICIEFHTGIMKGSIHSGAITNWEDKYARCHNFLSTVLNEMVRKKKLPHLEGLAAALLHSCPQQY